MSSRRRSPGSRALRRRSAILTAVTIVGVVFVWLPFVDEALPLAAAALECREAGGEFDYDTEGCGDRDVIGPGGFGRRFSTTIVTNVLADVGFVALRLLAAYVFALQRRNPHDRGN